jgi:translation initiation factor IF-3
VNASITSKTVRLINKYGVMHGIVSLDVAIGMANNENLDLVEINSTSNPVVCKIMNFSKYKYELKKKKQNSKKQQKSRETKKIRFKYSIEANDLTNKINSALKFLTNTQKVEVSIVFKGREKQHTDIGLKNIKKFRDACLIKLHKIEHKILLEPLKSNITLLLVPKDG